MSRTCIDPSAISEGDLIRYVDGEAGEAIIEHVRRCPACAEEAEALGQLQAALLAKLRKRGGAEAKRWADPVVTIAKCKLIGNTICAISNAFGQRGNKLNEEE
jgi:hypothetical protein